MGQRLVETVERGKEQGKIGLLIQSIERTETC
jgi:hypothetical protein